MVWTLENSRDFSVVSIREKIDEKRLPIVCSKTRWARQISRKIATWWNVQYVEVDSYEEWLAWLASFRLAANLKRLIEGVFYVSWWSIWTYRNKLLFDDKAPLKESIFDNIIYNSFHWCSSRCKASFSWNEWLKNPYLLSL
nr:RNA-directed DNA polymerase, eukaryota [Tanacetum cinerariifolium]